MGISTLGQEGEGEGTARFEEDPQSKSYIKYSKQIRDMKVFHQIKKEIEIHSNLFCSHLSIIYHNKSYSMQ